MSYSFRRAGGSRLSGAHEEKTVHHLFHLGPIRTKQDGESHFVFAFSAAGGISGEGGRTVAEAYEAAVKKLSPGPRVLEPQLAALLGAGRGRQTAPLPEEARAVRAAMALGLSHGTFVPGPEHFELTVELLRALAAFDEAEPWLHFASSQPLALTFEGAPQSYPEASVLGSGEVFGLALYAETGAVEKVERALRADDYARGKAVPSLTVMLDDQPAYLVQAVESFAGLRAAPFLVRLRRGEETAVPAEELGQLVAALRAVVELKAGREVGEGQCLYPKPIRARVLRPGAPVPAPAPVLEAGRNDPCPCGSGKKFKRCHGDGREARAPQPNARPALAGGASMWHEVDRGLAAELIPFATSVHRKHLQEAAEALFGARTVHPDLAGPYAMYEHPLKEGGTLVERFAEQRAGKLSERERQWIAAQVKARFSVWEVLEVMKEQGLRLHDLLTGEVRTVREVAATRTATPRVVLLARVVTVGGESVLSGLHPHSLPPSEADRVVKALGGEGGRRGAVALVGAWDEAVSAWALKLASPTVVKNTDGEPVRFVEERFAVAKGGREEVLNRLAGLEGFSVDFDKKGEAELTYSKAGNAFHQTWERTTLATVRVTKARLVAMSNSVERADRVKALLQAACGPLLSHQGRKLQEPMKARGGEQMMIDAQPMTVRAGRQTEVMTELKRSWLDEPQPSLGGRTPKQAAGTPEGRREVHALLRGYEHAEGLDEGGLQVKIAARLRAELGLDELGEPLKDLDVRRALGNGEKLSACLLDVAQPLLVEAPRSLSDMKRVVELAATVWNAAVVDAVNGTAELAAIRGTLIRSGMPTGPFDEMIARMKTRHGDDRRMVGKLEVTKTADGYGVNVAAHASDELKAAAERAGIKPPT